MPSKKIIIDDLCVTVYHSASYTDAPVVFLHGWGSRATVFKELWQDVPCFIAVDLPGFGESDTPKNPWSLTDYARFLENLLIKLNIINPLFVGHSFGGSVILKYCTQNREIMPRKILLTGSAGVRSKSIKKTVLKIITKILKVPFSIPPLSLLREKVRKKLYTTIDTTDYIDAGPMQETFKKIISEDLRDELPKITTPTVLIWGKDDKETPLNDGMTMNTRLPHSRIIVIDGASHYAFVDQLQKFRDIFLKEINNA